MGVKRPGGERNQRWCRDTHEQTTTLHRRKGEKIIYSVSRWGDDKRRRRIDECPKHGWVREGGDIC